MFQYPSLLYGFLGRCAFGIDVDMQNNPDNIYFRQAEAFFETASIDRHFLFRFAQLVPQIGLILAGLFSGNGKIRTFLNTRFLPLISPTTQLWEDPLTWLHNRLHKIVEQRQQTTDTRIDLLHSMLQAITKEPINISSEVNYVEFSLSLSLKETMDESKINYRLTQEEIIGNIFLFMAAGYDTTSAVIACATY